MHFESLVHVCRYIEAFLDDDVVEALAFANFSNDQHVEDLYRVGLTKNKTYFSAEFDTDDDSELFSEMITSQGLCVNFNLLKSSEIFKPEAVQHDFSFLENRDSNPRTWTVDGGYTDSSDDDDNDVSDSYPFRASRTGREGGLKLFLIQNDLDVDNMCRALSMPGYKIILNSPADYPVFGKHEFNVNMNKEVNVYVRPKKEEISDGLIGYSPER